MAFEIERKFLLINDDWRMAADQGTAMKQGYLNANPERTVRVRIAGDTGFLTIKGKNRGTTRPEFEYEIPLEDARQLITLCEQPVIEKIRYRVIIGEHVWEIDEFSGDNQGLMVAEIELEDENQFFPIPPWIGEEVSGKVEYYNSSLSKKPFKEW